MDSRTSHSTTLINHISNELQKLARTCQIKQLKLISPPLLNRIIFLIFGDNPMASYFLAKELISELPVQLIALEQPIIRTACIENRLYFHDRCANGNLDLSFSYLLKNLCEKARWKRMGVVCIDEVCVNKFSELVEIANQIFLESQYSMDRINEFIRTHIKIKTLYNFTNQRNVLWLNEKSDSLQILQDLKSIDPAGIFIPININESNLLSLSSINPKPIPLEGYENAKQFDINLSDANCLYDKNFIKLISKCIKAELAEVQNEFINREIIPSVLNQNSTPETKSFITQPKFDFTTSEEFKAILNQDLTHYKGLTNNYFHTFKKPNTSIKRTFSDTYAVTAYITEEENHNKYLKR